MKYIENIKMQMDANTSAKTVSPKIEGVDFTSPSRAFNQGEVDIFYEISNKNILPSNLIDINRLITQSIMNQLNDDYTNQRKTIVNKKNKNSANGLSLFSPVIDRNLEFDSTNLFTLLNLQLVSNLKVISIPDFHSKIGQFKEIQKISNEHISDYPEGEPYILPHLVSNSKDFKDKLAHIIDIGHRAFSLDIWGYSTSLGNLNYLQDYIRKSGHNLWIHSCNLERYLQSTNVSVPHVLTFFGVDTYSKRLFDIRSLWDADKGEFKEIKNEPESIRFFHEDSLGVIPKTQLPMEFIDKLDKMGMFEGGGKLQSKKSKLYEMIEGQTEFETCTERIKKSEFREYASEKECLRNTIQNLRLLES